jgi:hypothetical protein
MKNTTAAGGGEDGKAAVSKEARKSRRPAVDTVGIADRAASCGVERGGTIRPRRGDVQAAVGRSGSTRELSTPSMGAAVSTERRWVLP